MCLQSIHIISVYFCNYYCSVTMGVTESTHVGFTNSNNIQTDMRMLAVEQLFPATNSLPFPLEGVYPLPLHTRARERWDMGWVVMVTVFPRWGQSSSGAGVVVHKRDVLKRIQWPSVSREVDCYKDTRSLVSAL